MMRFFEEKEFREIGAQVGKSPDAVQKQIRRALDKLNRSLTAKGATFSLATIGLGIKLGVGQGGSSCFFRNDFGQGCFCNLFCSCHWSFLGQFFTYYEYFQNFTTAVVATILLVAAIPAVIQHSQAKEIRKELTELSASKQSLAMARSTASRTLTTNVPQTPVRRLSGFLQKVALG